MRQERIRGATVLLALGMLFLMVWIDGKDPRSLAQAGAGFAAVSGLLATPELVLNRASGAVVRAAASDRTVRIVAVIYVASMGATVLVALWLIALAPLAWAIPGWSEWNRQWAVVMRIGVSVVSLVAALIPLAFVLRAGRLGGAEVVGWLGRRVRAEFVLGLAGGFFIVGSALQFVG